VLLTALYGMYIIVPWWSMVAAKTRPGPVKPGQHSLITGPARPAWPANFRVAA